MTRKQKYQIERLEPGSLIYREGGTEYRFPIYDEGGDIVFVAWPTRQRIFLYYLLGGWTRVPRQFSALDRERITAHVVEHFLRQDARIRVITRIESEEQGFQFHPELFECKAQASEILDSAGFIWFSDYSSVDLLHEEFGLEICGIHEESNIEPIALAMRAGFPQWHYSHVCYKDYGREPGWKFGLHMFPRGCGDGRGLTAE